VSTGKLEINALACSLPIVKLAAAVRAAEAGALIEAVSDNPGFEDDLVRWCGATGHVICRVERNGSATSITLRKAASREALPDAPEPDPLPALGRHFLISFFLRILSSYINESA